MDETKIYIKMADCPEVQGQWIPEEGDFYIPYGKDYLSGYGSVDIVSGFQAVKEDKRRECLTGKMYERLIWLPRQDDIQRMLIKEKFGDFGAHWDMCIDIPIQFVAKNPDLELSSMEQIWLSCYMLSIHQKIWSSKEEKWVKK